MKDFNIERSFWASFVYSGIVLFIPCYSKLYLKVTRSLSPDEKWNSVLSEYLLLTTSIVGINMWRIYSGGCDEECIFIFNNSQFHKCCREGFIDYL